MKKISILYQLLRLISNISSPAWFDTPIALSVLRSAASKMYRRARSALTTSGAARPRYLPTLMSVFTAVVLNLLTALATPPAPITGPLTIDSAVQQALKHRPDLEALHYVTAASKAGARVERAGFFPTINLNNDVYEQKGQKDLHYSMGLSANQLIYSFAGPQHKYKKAKQAQAITELDQQVLSNKIRFEVEATFLKAWLLQEQTPSITALKKSAKANFKTAKHANKLQLLDKNDWLKSVEEYSNNIATIDQYNDTVQTTYKQLEFLMGQPLALSSEKDTPNTSLAWRYKKHIELNPLEIYYNAALTARPELKQASKRVAIEQQNIKIAHGTRLPTLAANADFGNVSTIGTPSVPIVGNSYYNFGISVSLPLFDGTVAHYQEQQAHANKIKELLGQDQLVLTVKQEVQDKYYTLSKSLTKRKAQKINYLRTRNEFKLRKQEFEIGQIAKQEFDTAQTAWEQAQVDWLSTNVEVAINERGLLFACGYPEILQQ